MSGRSLASAFVLIALGFAWTGCAPRPIRLPADPGTPLPDPASLHASVSAACAGVRTWTAELSLSGRARSERIRGRVHAGFARPDGVRLEGVAPFGAPVFVLAARDGQATLLLERQGRALDAEAPEALLGALTGVALAPADLLAVLTGCVTPEPSPTTGRLHQGGWASIDLAGDARLYLRRRGNQWEVRAALRDGWRFEYDEWQGGLPRRVRLQAETQEVDLSVAVAQLEVNTGIDPRAFELVVPSHLVIVTLDELRAAIPLRED